MKNIIFSLLLTILMLSFSQGKEVKCLSEKEITLKKVRSIIEPVFGAKVLEVSKSPVKGIYEVVIEARGRMLPIYIDCTLNYIITGEIIDIKGKRSVTRERAAELAKKATEEKIKKLEKVLGKERVEKLKKVLGERFSDIKLVDLSIIPKKNLVTYGPPKAKLTVYVVTDPECPFCAKFDEEMHKILKQRNDVKFEIILYPLPFHKHASAISQRIICEKSLKKKKEILNKSFEAVRNQNSKKLASLGKECEEGKKGLSNNLEFGAKAGIGGTPTIIFPHGIMISGWMTAEQINKVLDVLK